jgi:transposase
MVEEGYYKLEVARQMGVSRATIARWVEKERAAA